MSTTNRETLSALLDDEAEDLELRRVIRELEAEQPDAPPSLGETWYRYTLARTALQGSEVRAAPDFLARVNDAIDAQATRETEQGGGRWRRATTSFAVAASVAMVVLLGGQQLASLPGGAAGDERLAPLPVGVVNTVGAVPVQASYGTRDVPTLEPADRTAYRELARQRLRRYSQEHAEHAALNTPQGMLPFARVPVIER